MDERLPFEAEGREPSNDVRLGLRVADGQDRPPALAGVAVRVGDRFAEQVGDVAVVEDAAPTIRTSRMFDLRNGPIRV
jgi:hypothetical protein